jgi:hypothetical protein
MDENPNHKGRSKRQKIGLLKLEYNRVVMENIIEYVKEACAYGILYSVMGWDEKHGPTEEQWEAFKILFPDLD